MIIAIDIRSLNEGVGGVVEYTRNLVAALITTEKSHYYVLFTNGFKKTRDLGLPVSGVHHETIECRYPNKFFHACQLFFGRPYLDTLVEKKTGRRPDLFFFPNIHFASVSRQTPCVLTAHDLSFSLYPEFLSSKSYWWHRLVRPRNFIAKMSHIIAVSRWTMHDLVTFYQKRPEDVSVIPIDCDPDFRRHMASCRTNNLSTSGGETLLHSRTKIILFSAHEMRKNAAGALEGYSLFHKRHPDAHFTLVLIGKKRSIQRQYGPYIQKHGLQDHVSIVGTMTHDERMALYLSARILLYPSIYEGFGLPLVEAALCSVPIIASARASIGEVIGAGAVLVDPHNAEEIYSALNMVLSSDQKSENILCSAAHEAVADFSWEKAATETRAVFEMIGKENRV